MAWPRLVAAWDAFQAESRKRWWLYLVVFVFGLVFEARMGEVADTVVGWMNASGITADIVRGLIGPVGLLVAVILVLLVHAYWDTRPGRSRSGIQMTATGTVTTPSGPQANAPSSAENALRSELARERADHQGTKEGLAAAEATVARLQAELTVARSSGTANEPDKGSGAEAKVVAPPGDTGFMPAHRSSNRCHPAQLDSPSVPADVFPQHLQDYCAEREGLLATGRQLKGDLQRVSIKAKDTDAAPFDTRLRAWLRAVQSHKQEWWPHDTVPPLPAARYAAIPPYWRREYLANMGPLLAWLESVATDCDQTSSPATSSRDHT